MSFVRMTYSHSMFANIIALLVTVSCALVSSTSATDTGLDTCISNYVTNAATRNGCKS